MKITISFCLLLLVLIVPVIVGSEEGPAHINQRPIIIPNDVVSWKDDPFLEGYDLSRFLSYREFSTWLRRIEGRPLLQSSLVDDWDTSLYMIGNVSVTVILPESNNSSSNTENWTPEEIAKVHAEIENSLYWWAAREPNANLNFIIDYEDQVNIEVEPIEENGTGGWRYYTMMELGYHYLDYGGLWEAIYAYINDKRNAENADWGFVIFVVDSSNDPDGQFADNKFAFALSPGPQDMGTYLIMTYDNGNYGIDRMKEVSAHEIGHIFGAADQYSSSIYTCDCDYHYGYLYFEHQNCVNSCLLDEPSIMKYLSAGVYDNGHVDEYGRGQIGWIDDNENEVLDIVDFEPTVICISSGIDGDDFVIIGTANTDGLEAINPYYSTVKINEIAGVEYSVNDGAWASALAMDGSFDSLSEDYSIRHMLTEGDYFFRVRAVDRFGEMTSEENYFETSVTVTGVEGIDLPEAYILYQNYPNPFNPQTTIKYYLHENGAVQLEIFDVSGKRVATLVKEYQEKGQFAIDWNGQDQNGNPVSSGTYFYSLKVGKETISKKMILLK